MYEAEHLIGDMTGGAIRVAVVEDDRLFREAVVRDLARDGCRVFSAESPEAFFAHVQNGIPPDVLFLDLEYKATSDKTGIDVLEWIKERPDCRNLFIVMVSGHSEARNVLRTLKAGASDFLTKFDPYDKIVEGMQQRVRMARHWRTLRLRTQVLTDIMQEVAREFAHDMTGALATAEAECKELRRSVQEEALTSNTSNPVDGRSALRHVENIESCLNRLGLVRRDLQTLGVDLGVGKLDEELDLEEIVEGLAGTERPRISGGGDVTVELDCDKGLPKPGGSRRLIEASVRQIMQNAWKAMRKGGRLSMGVRDKGNGWVYIYVEDNGIGILPERIGRIFNFKETRWDGDGSIVGTGVGLFLVRRYVVDFHEGYVKVMSTVGRGTRFEIGLRVEDPKEGAG